MHPEDQGSARRWGAEAYDGARGRRDGGCFVALEMAFIGFLAGVYASGAHQVETPTAIAIGLAVGVAGIILSRFRVLGLLLGLALAVAWGALAGGITTALGNLTLGIVVGIVVGLVVAGLHLGYRR
jgi:hypothetical protein